MDKPRLISGHDGSVRSLPVGTCAIRRPHGRHRECERLDRLVASLWAGESRMLVVRGEKGVGKSTLLDYLAERASGCRVVRAAGMESERDLAFAGLQQFCSPFMSRREQLPEPQRDALGTVFGLRGGVAPDRFVVGMAVMGLLSASTADRPLVCILDDAQWLDEASAQILGFVARRLAGAPVAVAMAVCEDSEGSFDGGDGPDLTGVDDLVVRGLADVDARALLTSITMGGLDERVLERITVEARGNPLSLRQATSGLGPDQLAGGFGVPRIPLPRPMEKSLRQRVLPLPAATRQLLLVAAAEPTGDAELLWRAARQLGIKPGAAAPAVRTGLVEFDGMVRFCHPLARTFVYQAGSPGECRRVHRALAYATDSGIDPDRRAWHRARCAADYDEEVAADLERTAERARARGGLPALAAFRARAAELTADPADRSRRALAAAEVNFEAGAPIAARRLLAMAQAGSLDELATAHAQLLRAQLAAHAGHGSETSLLLVEAAQHLQRVQSRPARETYAVAFDAALTVGCLSGGDGAKQIALTVRAVPPTPGPSDGPDVLLEGLAVLISEGHDACAPLVKRALRMLRDEQADAGEGIRWLPLACRLAQQLWDDKSWHALTTRLIDHALHEGALTVLPGALLSGSVIRLLAEGCEAAVSLVQTAEAVGLATGNPVAPYARLALAAWRGAGTETSRLIVDATTGMIDCGQAGWPFAGHWATAVLNNGLARYNEALIAAKRGSEDPEELGFATWCLVELIEAAVRTGSPEEAAAAFARLSVSADASATTWALGIKARSLALMNEGGTAERLYLEAIDSLGRTLVRADLGRAHLLYGEWLRRQGRRVDARLQLRTAHDILIDLGIGGFAERARRELAATGATVRKGTTARDDLLTAQETQIAAMARAGHTNPQIGVELFISGRTVEWHLRKVFMKLGISSRRELSKALPA